MSVRPLSGGKQRAHSQVDDSQGAPQECPAGTLKDMTIAQHERGLCVTVKCPTGKWVSSVLCAAGVRVGMGPKPSTGAAREGRAGIPFRTH